MGANMTRLSVAGIESLHSAIQGNESLKEALKGPMAFYGWMLFAEDALRQSNGKDASLKVWDNQTIDGSESLINLSASWMEA